MTATNMGNDIAERIDAIRSDDGDTIHLDDVAGVVEGLIETMEGDINAVQVRLRKDLKILVDYIQKAKTEIIRLGPEEIHDEHIPVATDELDAVIRATEDATGAILDAAEELENLAGSLDGEVGQKIMDITTKIYEASNFQDVTGQRITKVLTTLRHIEEKVRALAEAAGTGIEQPGGNHEDKKKTDEDVPLHGPALPGEGNSQEDIDALMDSFD